MVTFCPRVHTRWSDDFDLTQIPADVDLAACFSQLFQKPVMAQAPYAEIDIWDRVPFQQHSQWAAGWCTLPRVWGPFRTLP